MKKIAAFLLILLLTISLSPLMATGNPWLSGHAWAADAVVLSLGSATGDAGDIVIIPLSIANNSGFCTFEFTISYDNAKLTPLLVSNTYAVWLDDIMIYLDQTPNSIFITGVSQSLANCKNNGVMANIYFKINDNAAPGVSAISLTARDFLWVDERSNLQDVVYAVNNGNITVNGAVLIGDINGDGRINLADLSLLAQYFIGGYGIEERYPQIFTTGDMNRDGKLESADLTLLADLIINSRL